MRQVLCAWFPNWGVQRVVRSEVFSRRRRRLIVLHSPLTGSVPRVVASSDGAARQGVLPGMPLAEARGLLPRAEFLPHDPAGDRTELQRLAEQCVQFTPRAGLEEGASPESLFLDLTGCEPHLGLLAASGERIAKQFPDYEVRLALAPTWGAAWALAHVGPPSPSHALQDFVTDEPHSLELALRPLSVRGLRLPDETWVVLQECGLQTIGELLDLPRRQLPSRLGPEVLLRLDQAFGQAEELLSPELPSAPVQAWQALEEPLSDLAALHLVLRQLLEEVVRDLQDRRLETQRLEVRWKTEREEAGACVVSRLRPSDVFLKWWELLVLRTEQLHIAEGITWLQLTAFATRGEPPRQPQLWEDDGQLETDFRHLVERLGSRLGMERIVRFRALEEFQPERAWIAEAWNDDSAPQKDDRPRTAEFPPPERPLRLLAHPVSISIATDHTTGPPLRFRWDEQEHVVTLCRGPERIGTGWWRGPLIGRDYYRIETTAGDRFWLFQDPANAQWFLQGVFE